VAAQAGGTPAAQATACRPPATIVDLLRLVGSTATAAEVAAHLAARQRAK